MRLSPEFMLSVALSAAVTAGYVALAAGGPPAASGLAGHTLGVAGFLAMLGGTAGYAWRKRRSGPGAMQQWMRAHVVTGLVGPYLVLLHTAFGFRGIAGVAFALMLVVVASGIAGRYAYTTIPKPPPDALRAAAHRPPMAAAGSRRPETSPYAATSEAQLQRTAPYAAVSQPSLQQHVQASLVRRRIGAAWWLLHVPLAVAMLVLAVVHVLGALYYATLLR